MIKQSFEPTCRIPDPYDGFADSRIRKLRLMHKVTGQVVNTKGFSLSEAVTRLEWDPDLVYWVDLGSLSVRWLEDHEPVLSFYFAPEPFSLVNGEEG